jgi:aspartate/tyrosine/aromatic aminotransferase
MYSMPPDHGAAVAARVLGEAELRRAWQDETAAMVARMKALRALLAGRLAERRPDRDFSWLTGQRGMFSLLGLAPAGTRALCTEEHVYVPPDGRINIAGVSDANVDRVADALVRVLERR